MFNVFSNGKVIGSYTNPADAEKEFLYQQSLSIDNEKVSESELSGLNYAQPGYIQSNETLLEWGIVKENENKEIPDSANIEEAKHVQEADVVTHGGIFHADECMAVAIYSAYQKSIGNEEPLKVHRAFNPKVVESMKEGAIAVDFGGGKFDHHQRGGNGERAAGSEEKSPYASAGLIWKEYGKELLKNLNISEADIDKVFETIDKDIIEDIDKIDNGVEAKATPVSLSHVVSGFNLNWDEDQSKAFEKFDEAANICSTVLIDSIEHIKSIELENMRAEDGIHNVSKQFSHCPDQTFINIAGKAIDNQIEADKSKDKALDIIKESLDKSKNGVVELPCFVPWQDHIFNIDSSKAKEAIYVVFPSNRGGFNVQAVPDKPGSFDQKTPLPEEWRGLRDDELSKASGVKDAIFCHPNGFICAANSLENAHLMAKYGLASFIEKKNDEIPLYVEKKDNIIYPLPANEIKAELADAIRNDTLEEFLKEKPEMIYLIPSPEEKYQLAAVHSEPSSIVYISDPSEKAKDTAYRQLANEMAQEKNEISAEFREKYEIKTYLEEKSISEMENGYFEKFPGLKEFMEQNDVANRGENEKVDQIKDQDMYQGEER